MSEGSLITDELRKMIGVPSEPIIFKIEGGEPVGIPRKVRGMVLLQVKPMTPEDAARPVLFLATDDAAFITGQMLNVSSGMYM